MRHLLKRFDHPEKALFPILIAGTKGKGSTGFFLESILTSAGIRTGFYSSPHLEDPRERIRIQGRMVSKQVWCQGVETVRRVLKQKEKGLQGVTYFEILTLLAALLFKDAGIEAAIFEVGMGGRFDATNALGANVVVLTPVHLDHEAILGKTIAKIAGEKAAVIHRGAEVVLSPQSPEALRVIQGRIREQRARLYPVDRGWPGKIGLKGDFQKINAAAAARTAAVLRGHQLCIPDHAIRKGLRASDWPGRMEIFLTALGNRVDLLLDGAHNPASIRALVRNLKKGIPAHNLLIFGTSRDKNSAEMLKILGSFFKKVVLCRNPNPRSQEIGTLIAQARPWFREIFPAADVSGALELAGSLARPGDCVTATGSFYLIGEIRKRIRHAHHSS